MKRRIKVGDRVKLLASRYYPEQIVQVAGTVTDGFGNVVSVDVDVARVDGNFQNYPLHEVELIEGEDHDDQ